MWNTTHQHSSPASTINSIHQITESRCKKNSTHRIIRRWVCHTSRLEGSTYKYRYISVPVCAMLYNMYNVHCALLKIQNNRERERGFLHFLSSCIYIPLSYSTFKFTVFTLHAWYLILSFTIYHIIFTTIIFTWTIFKIACWNFKLQTVFYSKHQSYDIVCLQF